MMRSRLARRAVLLLPFACAALYGCPQTSETTGNEEYADVLLEGDTTDEAMVALGSALDQKAPLDDPARAPVLDAPTGASIPASPIPTFTWHFGATASLGAPVRERSHGPALLRLPEPPAALSRPLLDLLGAPRAAHAHGDPFVGTGTYLVFSTKADPKLVRVFTGVTTYTPAQAEWSKLTGAGAEITLSLIAADFDNNRIADGGDPVQGAKVTFTITP